jgi:hypothetical protein
MGERKEKSEFLIKNRKFYILNNLLILLVPGTGIEPVRY